MFNVYEMSHQSHDAGYDAYMTGVVFATLAKHIEISEVVQPVQDDKKLKEKQKQKQKSVHFSTL